MHSSKQIELHSAKNDLKTYSDLKKYGDLISTKANTSSNSSSKKLHQTPYEISYSNKSSVKSHDIIREAAFNRNVTNVDELLLISNTNKLRVNDIGYRHKNVQEAVNEKNSDVKILCRDIDMTQQTIQKQINSKKMIIDFHEILNQALSLKSLGCVVIIGTTIYAIYNYKSFLGIKACTEEATKIVNGVPNSEVKNLNQSSINQEKQLVDSNKCTNTFYNLLNEHYISKTPLEQTLIVTQAAMGTFILKCILSIKK